MNSIKRFMYQTRRGAALIIAIVFVLIFSALAVSIAAMSGTNVQIASNQHKANLAFCAAQSGLEIMRYGFTNSTVPGTNSDAAKMQEVQSLLQSRFDAAGVTNIPISAVVPNTIAIGTVTLDTTTGQNFRAILQPEDCNKLRVTITGSCGDARKQLIVDYNMIPNVLNSKGVFGYGVATKGTMDMTGNATIDDVNITVKAGVYIEGGTASDAFSSAHNTSVAGDVSIADPYATVSVGGKVGGVQGGAGHVHIGAPEVDFPPPNPKHFLQYATGQVISGTQSFGQGNTFTNAIIKAGSTVTFASNTTIKGVLYIEQPSIVHFSGKATITGIIAGDGIENGHNGTSSLKFSGQVVSNDVSTLPDSYGAIKQETGTLICAPGFRLEFTGQDLNIGGAIAGNGISFSGQAGGMVKNSIINYSKDPDSMTMVGQGTLTFNRSDCSKPAAGFDPQPPDEKLVFVPNSYSESL